MRTTAAGSPAKEYFVSPHMQLPVYLVSPVEPIS